MITDKQAIEIAERKHGPGFKYFGITHGVPDNCSLYGNFPRCPDDVWCVLCSAQPGKLVLASSRAIVISKDTGQVFYDGSANDEG